MTRVILRGDQSLTIWKRLELSTTARTGHRGSSTKKPHWTPLADRNGWPAKKPGHLSLKIPTKSLLRPKLYLLTPLYFDFFVSRKAEINPLVKEFERSE